MPQRNSERTITKDAWPVTVHFKTTQIADIKKVCRAKEMTRPGLIRLAVKEFLDRFWTEREG